MSVKVFFLLPFFLFQGTSSHETQYTYVDHTDARKEEARQRELRRLENDQRQKEFQEKLRQRAEEAERQAGHEGVANGKCETLRDGETSVFLCEPETF